MILIYSLFLIVGFIGLLCYKCKFGAIYVSFGACALICLFSMVYFLTHINVDQSFILGGHFLFSPKFHLNPLGNFFSFVVSFVGFASSLYALNYAKGYEKKASLGVFACLFNFFMLSMLLVISADNVFSFMVLWELMTLISALLIMINDDKGADKSVMIYLGIAQVGAFCLVGALLIMGHFAGSFEFADFVNLKSNLPTFMSAIIFILLLIGFGSKAGMWPFHVWLPLAHPAAPSNVSALMSGVMIKVALFALIKFCLFLPISTSFGIALVILGAASSLFGVLYALCQHDYKSLLAYHSVENIGIILLGLGAGFYGLASGNTVIASLGFLAGFYHILNHATFKGLLFLSAGSVLHATGTRDMEVLGGLAKKMPYTAVFFFIGSMAITALPPLNGFMSEWITYKSLLLGGSQHYILARFVFSLSIVALALTGVLAVMCFVKVYSVIFGGTPRKEEYFKKAHEQPFFMLLGMGVLALGCIGFGIGAKYLISFIINPVLSISQNGSNLGLENFVSTPLIAFILVISAILPFILLMIFKANLQKPRETDPWACGFKYSQRMQMTASPFTGDLRKIMEWLFRAKPKVIAKDYFSPIEYHNHPKDIWWVYFYEPVIKWCVNIANKIGIFQNGQTNIYAGYILIYLSLIMTFGYYFL